MENKCTEGKLPTLDIKIWITEGRIWYQLFQKPMSNKVEIQEKSALSEHIKPSGRGGEEIKTHQISATKQNISPGRPVHGE